jgi:DNA-binding LacI/PurR family transcriptional regulator
MLRTAQDGHGVRANLAKEFCDSVRKTMPGRIRASVDTFYDRVCRTIDTEAVGEMLTPLFDQARRLNNVTAWVADNDATAVHALEYLRGHGIRVPGDIALVGFDNTLDAFTNRISSYDFAAPAILRAALTFVLHPADPVFSGSGSEFVVEGRLVERSSTGGV